VGLSEGAREFMGVGQAAARVKNLREEFSHLIFLNADRTHSLAQAEAAARAGCDEILRGAVASVQAVVHSRLRLFNFRDERIAQPPAA
jgi:hypothetical protein